MTERCENCRFGLGHDFDQLSENDRVFCRRYPPDTSKHTFGWPIVKFTDWCGEWQAIKEPKP